MMDSEFLLTDDREDQQQGQMMDSEFLEALAPPSESDMAKNRWKKAGAFFRRFSGIFLLTVMISLSSGGKVSERSWNLCLK